MGQPVVHFEIIGADPQGLRSFYSSLFDWEFDMSGPVAEAVSEAGNDLVIGHFRDPEGNVIGVAGGP